MGYYVHTVLKARTVAVFVPPQILFFRLLVECELNFVTYDKRIQYNFFGEFVSDL